jgi:hypothetical protein
MKRRTARGGARRPEGPSTWSFGWLEGRLRTGLLAAAVILVLIGMGLLLTGCDTSLARTPRMSESWSKGLPLGLASLNNQVGLAVDQAGGVCTVWVDLERELRFVCLNDRAGVEVDRALDLEVNRPQQPQLALDTDGQLHLTWLGKWGSELQVMYARLSADGEVLSGATPLSVSPLKAGRMVMAIDPVGQTVEVLWSDTVASRLGIYHAALDWQGTVTIPEELLVPDGLWPGAQVDRQGFVHLAWKTEPEQDRLAYHYAVYDPQQRVLGPAVFVTEPQARASLFGAPTAAGKFSGPWLGLDQDLVYLAWTLESRERGLLVAFTFYQAFPPPALTQGAGAGAFDYLPPETLGEMVHVQGADPALTGDPQFLGGQPVDQALAGFTQARGPRNLEMLQSAVVDILAGQIVGMEVVSATPGASLKPNIAIDGQGYRHLVWIDTAGFERYQVLYASMAPQVHRVLNPVTAGEILSQTFELGFGALTLIGFLPLYLMWAIPAFLVLLVFFLATQEGDLDQPRAAVALWAAILVYAVVKVWTGGGAVNRLSAGNLLSTPFLEAVAQWVVPLLITGLAVLVMRFYARRSGNPSIFASFFVFVLADAVLFSIVYLTPLLLLG